MGVFFSQTSNVTESKPSRRHVLIIEQWFPGQAHPPVAKFTGEIRWMKICWEALDFWKLRWGIVAVGRYQQDMGICQCNLEIQLHVSCGSPKLR